MTHPVRKGTFFAAVAALVVTAVFAATAVAATARSSARAHPCVVAAGSGDQAFTRNFNPFNLGAQRDFTWGGIYENLLISTAVGGGRQYNLLGKSFTWSKDGKTLTIGVRSNVKWSDGKPLTAADVLYSLTIGRQDKAADRISLVAANSNIAGVRRVGADKVAIRFKQVDSTFLGSQLVNVPIVPRHVWSKVKNVTEFANPNPVGSGPFNRVTRFSGQSYQLSKNKSYWAKGLPRIDCVERIFTASNDAGLLQIVSGQADWTHNFVPNVESAYQEKDPKNYHNAYLTTALPVSLTFNTTEYPYSLVAFRKGVSQAIDRNMVSKLGEYGYAPPTTALGLEQLYPKWINPAIRAKAKQLATFDPAAARKTFTDAGFTYRGSRLMDPKGSPVSFPMHVIGGWSDWVASLQIISRNLQAVGIDASVKIEPDWPAWVSNSAISGTKPSLIWSNGGGDPTPYAYFFSHFDPSQVVPTGQDALALGNFERNSNAQASVILRQFKGTLDRKKQLQAAYKLQEIFLNELPYIPLFIGPRWSTYSSKFFKGWVTWQNQYADPIFSTQQQVQISLLSLYYADSKKQLSVPALPNATAS
jgi:peptide/nickel transport system substrate-binding protein